MRQPALKSCAAPDCAQPGTHPPRDACALGGRDRAARNGRQDGGQHLPEILDRAQRRRQINSETFRRMMAVSGGGNSCITRGRNR
jgi:hypothetical protein